MRRREFVAGLAGAVLSSFEGRAQQENRRVRRIGVLTPFGPYDAEGQARLAAFVSKMQQLGWTVGQNLRMEHRWGDGKAATMRKYAAELVALSPDVILANASPALAALLEATREIPIVFAAVADPVGAGYVASMGQPGGNATGFANFDYSIAAKWLGLLQEIAPGITRAAILRDAGIAAGPAQFGVIQGSASTLGVDLRAVNVRVPDEIERSITAFALMSNGGLIVTGSPAAAEHRDLIIALAARHRLPAVYNTRTYVTAGGLISYGPNFIDQFRRAAEYVDRILRGEKPSGLPVQPPTKYETVINQGTARALGLTIPESVLARADEVV